MSMFTKTIAARENVKLKIGMAGPSGSGKTYSALQLAFGIAGDWSKITVADTENDSAKYYADMGPWEHVSFDPTKIDRGYHPDNWINLIRFVEQDPKTEVLILDSISHEWDGKGGILDIVDDINKGFAGWKMATPMHNGFIDAIRLSRLHVIATMRTKTDYVVETNEKGKSAPKKVGLKVNQREGVDYEFGVVFDVDINHYAVSSKDRTGLFMPRKPFKISPAIGKELVTWATSGIEVPEEKYDNVNAVQRSTFLEYTKKHKVLPSEMPTLAKQCIGIPMANLAAAVKEFVEAREPENLLEGTFEGGAS